ncbi:uncharacterized protein [Panulirus ornatus]|uniref:uncharacterized protein isoform X4 n=1 Tax=Panulirus ornatus TaxID=150431 RepID=UPI003A8BE584
MWRGGGVASSVHTNRAGGKPPKEDQRPSWLKKVKKTEPAPPPEPCPEPEPAEPTDDNDVLCPLCSELYDDERHQPVLLPRCGHTFCRPCLAKGEKRGHFPCPTCRKRHLKPPVNQIPIHTDLLARAEAFRESKLGRCEAHGEPLAYWCRQCHKSLCGNCTVKKGHEVIRTTLLLAEKREEMKEQGDMILQNVMEEKKKIMNTVKNYSLQLLKTCEASTLADDSAHDVKDMLADTKKTTADVHYVLGSLKRMKSILRTMNKTSSDGESERTPRFRRRRRDNQKSQPDTTENKSKTDSKHNQDNNNRIQRSYTSPQIYGAPRDNHVQTMNEVGYAHYSQRFGTLGTSGRTKAGVASNGPLLGMLDASLWPLRCCVYSEDGRRARLTWEDRRLHMYALGDQADDAHFMIKMSVVQSLIPQENAEVFLDLTAGGRRLGRIYIRLWGNLRRAQHFLALCMGTHGPSYRGSKFEEVYSRGLKGECLHAGPYLTQRGELSAQGVMDNLEWDGKFKSPQRAGMVVGAGSGRPDRDACFDICTIENPARNFACPFGEVVGGWEVVTAAVNHRPVRQVTMQEVGVVISDLTSHNP